MSHNRATPKEDDRQAIAKATNCCTPGVTSNTPPTPGKLSARKGIHNHSPSPNISATGKETHLQAEKDIRSLHSINGTLGEHSNPGAARYLSKALERWITGEDDPWSQFNKRAASTDREGGVNEK